MKLYRSLVGSRGTERGRRLPAEPLQESHPLQSPLPVQIQSPWERLQTHFRREFLTATIFVIVASIAVISPMLVLGTVAGRDFPFHLGSWMDVARQWHEGTIYPQWAELANWGFGEPRFVFYPPGSWTVGAALGSLLPWKVVPLFFVWLVLIGAGLSMFLLARESMPRQQAALAAMLFAANPYHLLLVYYRSDFAELLASALFPLLPWGVMRIRPEQNFLFSRATSMAVNTDFNLKISCVVLLMGALIAVAAVHLAKSAAIPRLHY